MKEKIFKLYNSENKEDQLIGRELLIRYFKDDIKRLAEEEDSPWNGRKTCTVKLEDFEKLLGMSFNDAGSWSGIWFYKDELL